VNRFMVHLCVLPGTGDIGRAKQQRSSMCSEATGYTGDAICAGGSAI
jgi:hypothetical protein